jgi:hypothetical protein
MTQWHPYPEAVLRCPYCHRVEYQHGSNRKGSWRRFNFTGHMSLHYRAAQRSKWNRLKMYAGKYEFLRWETL